ncbi:MAG TPA: hypothetical protein VMW10_01235 [Alphaproteobacteria bacterium]|nr:hypothetical protein [Alphaproteobacteria bacterium]
MIENALSQIVNSLVNKQYSELENEGILGSLNAMQIEDVINSYPGVMTKPSAEEFNHFYYYEYDENSFYLEFDLFFNNKRSDLTLCVEGYKKNSEIKLKIQDIRVL